MRELDRISRLFRLLIDTYTRPVSLSTLQERLDGASSATVKRDIAFLRDSLFIPVVYDRDMNGYYIQNVDSNKRTGYSVPGLWITGEEAYGFLTLYNVMRKIDPGVLSPLIAPLRGVLKKVLSDSQVRRYGFDQKISVELDFPKLEDNGVLSTLSYALAEDESVVLKGKSDASFLDGNYFPRHLSLRSTGWTLTALFLDEENRSVEMPTREIEKCEIFERDVEDRFNPPFPAL